MSDLCVCGCGYEIRPEHPDPDFRFQQCQRLWLASWYQPQPELWRFEQRLTFMLLQQNADWAHASYDYVITYTHLVWHDPAATIPRALEILYVNYEHELARFRMVSTLPRVTGLLTIRVPEAAVIL